MAKYTIISDVGKGILELLRDKLVPDIVDKSESIGICEPKERGGYIVGIHPYDIKEDTSGTAKEPKNLPDGSVQDPPAMMELYYAISVSSKAEIESKALDEARIIGKIIQVLKDNPVIPSIYLPSNPGMPLENVSVTMLPLNMEEKVKIWTMFGESYKLSVFYVVGPVAIDSENIKKPIKRVEKVYIDSKQYEHKDELHFETFIKDEDIDDEYTQRPDEDEDEAEEDDYGSGYGDTQDSGTDDYGQENLNSEEPQTDDYASDDYASEDLSNEDSGSGAEEQEPIDDYEDVYADSGTEYDDYESQEPGDTDYDVNSNEEEASGESYEDENSEEGANPEESSE